MNRLLASFAAGLVGMILLSLGWRAVAQPNASGLAGPWIPVAFPTPNDHLVLSGPIWDTLVTSGYPLPPDSSIRSLGGESTVAVIVVAQDCDSCALLVDRALSRYHERPKRGVVIVSGDTTIHQGIGCILSKSAVSSSPHVEWSKFLNAAVRGISVDGCTFAPLKAAYEAQRSILRRLRVETFPVVWIDRVQLPTARQSEPDRL